MSSSSTTTNSIIDNTILSSFDYWTCFPQDHVTNCITLWLNWIEVRNTGKEQLVNFQEVCCYPIPVISTPNQLCKRWCLWSETKQLQAKVLPLWNKRIYERRLCCDGELWNVLACYCTHSKGNSVPWPFIQEVEKYQWSFRVHFFLSHGPTNCGYTPLYIADWIRTNIQFNLFIKQRSFLQTLHWSRFPMLCWSSTDRGQSHFDVWLIDCLCCDWLNINS